jgi:hypothetical protein
VSIIRQLLGGVESECEQLGLRPDVRAFSEALIHKYLWCGLTPVKGKFDQFDLDNLVTWRIIIMMFDSLTVCEHMTR